MQTFQAEKKELEKEIKALEKKELHIGLNYKFYRKHPSAGKECIRVVGYDNDFVELKDVDTNEDGTKHFVQRHLFNGDNFSKDCK